MEADGSSEGIDRKLTVQEKVGKDGMGVGLSWKMLQDQMDVLALRVGVEVY